jgi:hypothetical protein
LTLQDQYNQLFIDSFKQQKPQNIDKSFKQQAANESYDQLEAKVSL